MREDRDGRWSDARIRHGRGRRTPSRRAEPGGESVAGAGRRRDPGLDVQRVATDDGARGARSRGGGVRRRRLGAKPAARACGHPPSSPEAAPKFTRSAEFGGSGPQLVHGRLAARTPVGDPLLPGRAQLRGADHRPAAAARPTGPAVDVQQPVAVHARPSCCAAPGPGSPPAVAGPAPPAGPAPAPRRPASRAAPWPGSTAPTGTRCRPRPGCAGRAAPRRPDGLDRPAAGAAPPAGSQSGPSRSGPRCPRTRSSSRGAQQLEHRQPVADGQGAGGAQQRADLVGGPARRSPSAC